LRRAWWFGFSGGARELRGEGGDGGKSGGDDDAALPGEVEGNWGRPQWEGQNEDCEKKMR
jgi:hypothetical protein